MAPPISMPEYFANKTLFITGSTGFMGKVLVEKMLRCCPDIKKMYLLMRPKKGHSSKERLDDLLAFRVFDRLKAESPKLFEKLHVIPGDILIDNLGITEEDRKLIQQEAQIIFHCAACVRFDMFIKDAVKMNTVGTKMVLDLADGVKNLEAFIHVSTSYCRCELQIFEEKLYPADHKPQNVMHAVEWMDDDLLRHLQPKLIEPQPNTYAYTKSLTEDLVSQHAGKFPIAIARPSIVTAALKEPMPGWVDNLNGPTGLLVGAGKGVIRTMHCNENYQADVIPVDIVVNACIVLAYLTAVEKPKEIQICNIAQSGVNPITWGEALDMGRVHVQEFPFSICLWHPGGSAKSNWLHHQLALFFTHVLPAYFVDLLLFLMGKKTFMIKMQKRINYGLQVLQYYTTKEWHFVNNNFTALQNRISRNDAEVFYTDVKVINWSRYIRDYIKGAREYCVKEDPANLPQARKLQKQLYYLDLTMKVILGVLLAYFSYYYISMLFSAVSA
ncbi:putative fatty acyl-CoA reductase CG5065 [Anticarsia gemmatalis]|uniref:putative fatty acyl-CoA reductase CG5065 n=1 Tax=Anticarsia gemmatalis TaxID=129554 RepID=UPI003F75DCFE